MLNVSSLVIVAHKFVTQPDDDLLLYLNSLKIPNVMHIKHSFADAPDRTSSYAWYRNGSLYKEKFTKDYAFLPEWALYIKEAFYTMYWLISSGVYWEQYIGMDGMTAMFGNILKILHKVRHTIYWVIDFVPNSRFKSRIKNFIYKVVNTSSYRVSDEVWDLSPRMKEAREKYWGINQNFYKKIRLVPYGVWLDRVRKFTYEECEKNTLVFMGHLIEKQGVQYVIKLIPQILKTNPTFRFKIIGTGYYESTLKEMAMDLGVAKACNFMGKLDNDILLEQEIAKSCVAVAPYIKDLDTWTYYADPGKIKKYLACGVPVVLTDIPWNSQDIMQKKCGVLAKDLSQDLLHGVAYLFRPDVNSVYRKNWIEYSTGFDYKNIFGELYDNRS